MLIDLGFITLIGCVLEFFATKFGSVILGAAAPSMTFAFLMVFFAVARWNWWGILTVPFMALANVLGGHFSQLNYIAAVYDWRIFVSTLIGLSCVCLNSLFYRKIRPKKILQNNWIFILFMIVNYSVICFVQVVSYRLLCTGTLTRSGEFLYEYYSYSQEMNVTVNLCRYGEGRFVYNLFSLVVALVGAAVLRSQGVLDNAVKKLIDDREEAEKRRINEEEFSLNTSVEASDSDSQELEEEDSDDNTAESDEN